MSEVWTAVYSRRHVQHEEQCPSLDAALAFLRDGEDAESLASVEVRGPDGRVVIAREAFTGYRPAVLFGGRVAAGPDRQATALLEMFGPARLGWTEAAPAVRVPTCPDCGTEHDPRPCAVEGASCDCCSALYAGQDQRAEAAEALDAEGVPA